MFKLHQIKEGMQLLRSRPAASSGAEAQDLQDQKWHWKSVGIFIALDLSWPATRHAG